MRLGAQTPPISNEKIELAQKFLDGCGAFWIELDVRAMKRAQKLATEFMIRPADACIVACAIEAGCKYLFTKDDMLITSAQSLQEIKVTKP
ncbi:MAG: PIN domain-containing protein [Corynebacterium sp.]|uniref:PIN domain-containing protein n=1 Tax=Corynebacterium sp. TaxID=1720 RepID=UPI0026DCFE45|nr:PIN domain-containing protein [Corynebacterium sp.]MDO4762066.1 PIN domain-containing protein [Corynebacterium sp.]